MTARALKGHAAGTHRLVPPAQTFERLRPLLPALGITRIANVTGLDHIGIPVVMVTRPNARSLAVSQGKGLDLDAARASGAMESLELHHAETPTLPLKLGSWNLLRAGHRLIDVTGLPRVAGSALHGETRLLWVEGRDLMAGGAPVWLPYELVHADFTLPLPSGSGAFLMSTSGLASGNHPLEALTHGLCELVERDAVTLWHLGGAEARRRTRLDLATVDDPDCRALLSLYERAEVDVAVWDATSDLGLATFFCTIVDRSDGGMRALYPASGSGCHPARQVALVRALTEAAQSRLTAIAGSREDVAEAGYDVQRQAEALRETRARLRHDGPWRSFQEVPTLDAAALEDDVAWVLARLHACGLRQAVAVDLTRPELGIPVVRVVVPGLEPLHAAPGYSPGARARRRLEEVTR